MNLSVFNTYISPGAKEQVGKVLDSTFLSEGKIVQEFEKKLCNEFQFPNCTTLNSGTSALHLALDLAGIKEGDEVIIPAQTFVATGLVVLQHKAIPVFADIDYLSGNISVDSVAQKITEKTKAIIAVHWAGYPCEMDELNKLAKKHSLVVIEDAAHALGANYKNKMIGTISDFTCFSFQAIKHLTTGDGGAIVCKNEKDLSSAIKKKWFGIDRNSTEVSELGERNYSIDQLGYKYHLNNYSAALGLENLNGFAERMKSRRTIADFYIKQLKNYNGIQLFEYNAESLSAYWLFGFHVTDRLNFIRALKSKGISASVVHQRIDRNKIFGGLRSDLPNQEKFDASQIHIPLHDGIDMEKATYIVETIKQGW